jgi:hypothetical protein
MSDEVYDRTAPTKRRPRTYRGAPRVHLDPQGRIALNVSATRHLPEDCRYVHVLWDRERRRLAVQPAPDDENAYRLTRHDRRGSVFTARRELRARGLVPSQGQSFRATWDAQAGLLEVSLEALAG